MISEDGPKDYVVFRSDNPQTLYDLCTAIKIHGMWDPVVKDDAVILPGQCVPGTEKFMDGFVNGFLITRDHLKE